MSKEVQVPSWSKVPPKPSLTPGTAAMGAWGQVPWVLHCCWLSWPRWGQGGSRDKPAANQAAWMAVVMFTRE